MWKVCNAFAILLFGKEATYWQNLQGGRKRLDKKFDAGWATESRPPLFEHAFSELPTQRSTDAEIIFVGSNRRLAVKIFVNMETPPEVLHDLDPQVRSRL